MSLILNGSGTIEGLVAGGLPDATITNEDLVGNITNSKLAFDGGALSGFRNRLINGGFDVWQRATSGIGTTYNFISDRWAVVRSNNSAGMSTGRSTDVPVGFQYSQKIQRDSGNTSIDALYISQIIETVNSIPLAGKTVTLSFYGKSGTTKTGNLSAYLHSGTGIDQAGNNITLWSGFALLKSTAIASTTTWTRYESTVAVPLTVKQLSVQFAYIPTGTAGVDDSVYITGVQLEEGSVATPFEHRPYGTELVLCQRYYEKSFQMAVAPAQNAGTGSATFLTQAVAASTGAYYSPISFKTLKRATPTAITLYNPGAANAQMRNYTTGTDFTSTVLGVTNEREFQVVATSPAGSAIGNQIALSWTAEAEL